MFSGLFGDQFIISKVKRQIRLNRLTTEKINKHNAVIKAHCMNGDKNLITNSLEKTMSLQKIQVELEVIREMSKSE